MTVVQLGVTPLVVVDLECTGLKPSRDRVVEIAIIRLAPNGDFESDWHTLVNPRRPAGPEHAHGLTESDLVNAPLFGDLADELEQRLDGAVVVAHNANFDASFLRYEYARLDRCVPQWPLLCTTRAANRLGRATQARSRSLVDLCALEGISHPPGVHTALGDATATAQLLGVYLYYAVRYGYGFPDLGVRPVHLPPRCAPVIEAGITRSTPRVF